MSSQNAKPVRIISQKINHVFLVTTLWRRCKHLELIAKNNDRALLQMWQGSKLSYFHLPLWFSLVEVKSEALLTPKGGADASCRSSESPCPRSAWRFKSHKPHPCPHHLMAINLSSHFMTNTDLCHSKPNMDLYLHCREHLARFKFFFDEDALHMILKFSKEWNAWSS